MPSKHQWEDANAVAHLQAVFDTAVLLYIRTRILVHGRARKGDGPCPCCGSTEARIIEERPDLELLIDRVTGERRLRSEVKDKAGFDALAGVARLVDLPLRCHRHQLRLLLDGRHKILGALGGNRSGKTAIAVVWFVRQLILRGGRGAVFWWVAPSRSQTMIGVAKLVLGEVSDRAQPPALPLDDDGRPFLVVSWPETPRSSDQRVVLVDGTIIELHHASRPTGDNLKGRSVRGILLDEACAVAHRPNWGVLCSRLMDSGGQLFFATTPKGGHWLKEEAIDAQATNKDIFVESLSTRDNPWVSKEELRRTIAVCRDENHIRREIDGQWVSDAGNLWIHFNLQKHTADDPSFGMLRDRQDITAQACRTHWRGGNPWVKGLRTTEPQFVMGQDFNISPMTSVIARVFGDPAKPETWGVYVLDEVQSWNSDTWKHGNWLKSDKVRSGRVSYAHNPIACDSTGCNYDPTTVRGSTVHGSSAAKTLADLGFDARACGLSPKGYPQNPRLLDSISLMHKLMREDRIIVHGTRCPQLLRALSEQQVRANGLPEKVSNTASDKLSSPIDGLRYLCWALFSDQFIDRPKTKVQAL